MPNPGTNEVVAATGGLQSHPTRQIRVIRVPLDMGASRRGVDMGPSAMRVAGLEARLEALGHRVTDGLDQLEVLLDKGLLLIHPRCTKLKAAFQNYARRRTGRGDWLDEPADPQHPHEDLMDALRGGVRDRFPEGRVEQPTMHQVRAGRIL